MPVVTAARRVDQLSRAAARQLRQSAPLRSLVVIYLAALHALVIIVFLARALFSSLAEKP